MSARAKPVQIETARLLLRPPCDADADAIIALAGAGEIAQGTGRLPHPYTRAHAREFLVRTRESWEGGTAATFAIALRDHGDLVGVIGLEIDGLHNKAELGFWVGVPHWNRGYCTEAAGAVLDYGFRARGLERIYAGHFAGNEASGRVQRKIGMVREGVLRHDMRRFGTYHDLVMHAILREEWLKLRGECAADGR